MDLDDEQLAALFGKAASRALTPAERAELDRRMERMSHFFVLFGAGPTGRAIAGSGSGGDLSSSPRSM